VSSAASSNAQCEQLNNSDPNQEHRKGYGIVIEPVPTMYVHDVPPRREARSASHGQRIVNAGAPNSVSGST
jgi:hypothetical protein